MLTEEQLEQLIFTMSQRLEEVNSTYLISIGDRLNELKKLRDIDIHRLKQMQLSGTDIETIKQKLAAATMKNLQEIDILFDKLAKEEYILYEPLTGIPYKSNDNLIAITKAVADQTKNAMINLSNTTVITDSYLGIIDKFIIAISEGVEDRESALKQILKDTPGLRVKYASGVTRRLDSAARMNLRGGIRDLSIRLGQETGKQFGADGVEISVHALPAEDHSYIQGQQYTLEEFQKLQNTLVRPIGELNCRHVARPVILGISQPQYSKDELKGFVDNAHTNIKIGHKEYTKYEVTQLMRQEETKMRYLKEKILVNQASGLNISNLKEELLAREVIYKGIANKANLRPRFDRTKVPLYD